MRHVLLGLALLTSLSPSAFGVKKRRVDFKDNPTKLTAIAKQRFFVDLKSLLKETGTGTLQWSVSADKPAWLTMNAAAGTFEGTPAITDVGTRSFRLGVQDGDSGAFAQVDLKVILVPEWQKNPVDLGIQNEDVPFRFDLKEWAKHPAGGKLTFTANGLEPWMTLTPEGIISGTPRREHVKKYSAIVFTAATESGGTADAGGFGEVLKTVKPPKWKANPLVLAEAFEDSLYTANLAPQVNNIEGTALTFDIIGPKPNWFQLSAAGGISGTPGKNDLGTLNFTARVSTVIDGQTYTDNTVVQIKVNHVNHPPAWLADPVTLPDAFHGVLYSQTLKNSVVDPDGDPLTFKMINGPNWASLAADGTFRGTPAKSDVGNQTWIVEVTDGQFAPRATLRIVVKKSNEPPKWLVKPTELPNADEDKDYSQNLISRVTDPDNDPLTFTLVSGPQWLSLTSTGILSGKPAAAQIGTHRLRIKVADNISGSDEADVVVIVNHVNHPPTWLLNPINVTTAEDAPMSFSIAQHAKDVDAGDTLTFSLISGAPWAKFTPATATFSGTPVKADVGTHKYIVRVTDKSNATADVEVNITVTPVNHAPKWTKDPIPLPNAKEGTAYNQSVASYATDPDGDALTFALLSGPAWVGVDPQGRVFGTPKKTDAGTVTLKIQVKDPGNLTASTTATFIVEKLNTPPRWKQNPISLPDATTETDFTFNLAPLAEDDEADPLSFKKVSGPAWMTVSPTGAITGRPLKADAGPYTAVFEVSDGQLQASANANGRVILKNTPPVITPGSLTFTIKEREVVVKDLKQFVTDAEGDALTFSLIGSGSWLSLSSSGSLQMSPEFKQIGDHAFKVQVSDGKLISEETLKIKVLRDPRPPKWLENPIKIGATKNTPLSASIADKAKDEDNLPLTFSKVSGPAWLTIAADGKISGTPPTAGDIGFVVSVKNDLLSANTDLIITVASDNKPPFWTANPIPLPDAPAGKAYTQTVVSFAKDPNNDPLTFSKVSGPGWAFVTSSGTIIGTPADSDIGGAKIIVRVSDPENLFADAEVAILVVTGNKPPKWKQDPINLGNVVVNSQLAFDLTPLAEDPDKDPLTFKMISGPSWMNVSAGGQVSGKPQGTDVGPITAVYEVSDGKLTAQVGVIGQVVPPENKPPKWKQNPINLGVIPVNMDFTFNVAVLAEDPDNDPLTFKKISGPAWLNLSPSGIVTGKPLTTDVGPIAAVFEVSDGKLTAQANVTGQVVQGNRPPKWKQDPINLGSIPANTQFTYNVAQHAEDPDNDPLTYKKISGPAWLTVTANGGLTAKPTTADVGPITGVLEVSDGRLTAQVGITGQVIQPDNRPPSWKQNPINLGTVPANTDFTFNVAVLATDPDNDPLTYKKISGPAWLNLSPAGIVTGKPLTADVGPITAVFEVSDGKLTAQADVIGQVTGPTNKPPVISQNIVFVVKQNKVLAVNMNDPKYASDPDGDPITFKLIDIDTWVTLSAAGELKATPTTHLGEYGFRFEVSDGKATTKGSFLIRVQKDDGALPIWLQDPLRYEAKVNVPFSVNIAAKAKDPSGGTLTFRKGSGPAWLNVSPTGDLTGTPGIEHLNENLFTVTATNAAGGTDVTVIITVKQDGGEIVDKIQIDKAVPNAPSEQQWVIDNAWLSRNLAKAVIKNINVFYDALKAAQINHTGVMLSANINKWDGLPVKGSNGQYTFGFNELNPAASFIERANDTFALSYCPSPVWALFRFYQRVVGMPEIYHANNYYIAGVPTEVLLMTQRPDYWKSFTSGKPQANWTAMDFANHFINFHKTESKPYRVHGFIGECGSGDPCDEDHGAPPQPKGAHQQIIQATGGLYWGVASDNEVAKALREYADAVIFRAYVNAKKAIKLSKQPTDPNNITVKLAGTTLPKTHWKYVSASNEVHIDWSKIDQSSLKPGDMIEISYYGSRELAD